MSYSLEFYFKDSTPTDTLKYVVSQCNKVLLKDFGQYHLLKQDNPPELIATATNKLGVVVGLLTLHYIEAASAWELGTMSALEKSTHNNIFMLIMVHVPDVLMKTINDPSKPTWIVKRVKQDNRHHIKVLKQVGFEEPEHFLVGVLSNEGYIPFDPFDEVLMKRRLCPVAVV